MGRYGPFLEQGDRRASLPDKMPPDELTLAAALEMLDKAAQSEQPLGVCPADATSRSSSRWGVLGRMCSAAAGEDDEKPQNASLLKGMQPEDVTLDVALKLLSLPRELGQHPQTVSRWWPTTGRYGPYVKCGDETRSLAGRAFAAGCDLGAGVGVVGPAEGRAAAAARARSRSRSSTPRR